MGIGLGEDRRKRGRLTCSVYGMDRLGVYLKGLLVHP